MEKRELKNPPPSCTLRQRRAVCMKRFEYKFVEMKAPIGFDTGKKLRALEEGWNQLGREGWQFCMNGDGVLVFMREITE